MVTIPGTVEMEGFVIAALDIMIDITECHNSGYAHVCQFILKKINNY